MSDSNAKIRISLKDGEFELSGSELFVSQQIESFRELIAESLQKQKFELKTPSTNSNGFTSPPASNNPPDLLTNGDEIKTAKNFQRVFHIDNDSVKIIKRAPGSNNSQKSVATALIYLWAKDSLGQTDVTYPEIRDLCKNQGCLDAPNFAAHMKSAREEIVLTGKGRFTKCELTIPGKERALAIIEDLNK